MRYIINVRLLRHHAAAKGLRIRKDGDTFRIYTELPRCQLGDGLVGPVDFDPAADFVAYYGTALTPERVPAARPVETN